MMRKETSAKQFPGTMENLGLITNNLFNQSVPVCLPSESTGKEIIIFKK